MDLKAALFSKQREATKGKQYDSNILSSRKVSDKVSTCGECLILFSAHHHIHTLCPYLSRFVALAGGQSIV